MPDDIRDEIARIFRVPGYMLGHRPPTRWERFVRFARLSRWVYR